MISRIVRCAAQSAAICLARLAPMPGTRRSLPGLFSMTSKTESPKAATSFFAYTGPIPRIIREPRYFSIAAGLVGAVAFRKEARNLQTVGTVIGPAAAGLHEFAGRNQRRVADDRDRLAAAARLDLQDAEARLRAVKHDPFDEPGEDLAILARLRCCRRHPRMMARRRSGSYRMSWESGAPSPVATTLILIGA